MADYGTKPKEDKTMAQYVAELELQFENVTEETDSFHIQITVKGADGGKVDGVAVTIDGEVTETKKTTSGTANFTVPQKDQYEVTAKKDGETTTGYIYETTFDKVAE